MNQTAIVRLLRRAALALACTGLGACSYTLLPPNVTPNVPLTHSVEQAARKLEDTRVERAKVEARYAAEEAVCYAKFFVNACLDKAKEQRRGELATLRAVELEAEYFVRKSEADARDRELAVAAKAFAEEEARFLAQPPQPTKAAADAGVRAPARPRAPKAAKSAAPTAAEQQAEAAKRAANVVAYEKRQAELAKRQRRVEEKKAERAAKDAKPK
jgi:colicin import membrane protein